MSTYLIAGYDLEGYEGKNYDNLFETEDYDKLSGDYEEGYIQLFDEGYFGYILGVVEDGMPCVIDVNKVSHAKKRVSRILSRLMDKQYFTRTEVPPKYQVLMFEAE